MRKNLFIALCFVLVLGAGASLRAQDTAQQDTTPMMAPPGSTSDLPFVNSGANQPVLQPLSPEGEPVAKGHGNEHGAKKGLPQFDTSTFARQIFWLFLSFVCLYLVFARKTLPAIASVLTTRKNRIDGDIHAAQNLKLQVEDVRTQYQTALAQAQGQSQKLAAEIQAEAKADAEKRDAAFKAKSDAAVKELENKLNTARAAITAELGTIAATLAADITNKVTGVQVDAASAQSVVNAHNDKAKAA